MTPPPREGSAEVAARVAAARDVQLARFAALGLDGVSCNAAAPASVIELIAEADDSGLRLLRDAAERLRLSARGYHRVLKLARTLADLDGGGPVRRAHLAEALSYRGAANRGRGGGVKAPLQPARSAAPEPATASRNPRKDISTSI